MCSFNDIDSNRSNNIFYFGMLFGLQYWKIKFKLVRNIQAMERNDVLVSLRTQRKASFMHFSASLRVCAIIEEYKKMLDKII